MSVLKKCAFSILPFASSLMMATPIPQYEVSSIQGNLVSFTNNASFRISSEGGIPLLDWQPGDLIEILASENSLFPPHFGHFVEGKMMPDSKCSLHNMMRADRGVAGYLELAPSAPGSGVLAILSIDQEQRLITLDDLSQWAYMENQEFNVSWWQTGDLVMWGGESSARFPHFTNMLLNTETRSTLNVMPH